MKNGLASIILIFGFALSYGQIKSDKEKTSCDDKVEMPTSFCPSCDGINVLYVPHFKNPPLEYSLVIYNRWGEKMFESTDYLQGWDGKYTKKNKTESAPAGNFFWTLSFAYPNSQKHECRGSFVLIR